MTTTTAAPPSSIAALPPERGIAPVATLPSADIVKSRLADANTPPEHLSAVLWLLDYGRSRKLSTSQLAERVKRDGSTLNRVFNGRYGAALDSLVDDIEHFRKVETERQDFGEVPFVETKVFRDVSSLCDLARVSGTIGLLWGPNQSGKTTALKEYQRRNNHGRTIYCRMPVGGATRGFYIACLRACGISERNAQEQMRDRLMRYFDSTMLLIVDEVHQCLLGRTLRTYTIDAIRELHDETGAGVVLCGTDVLPAAINDPRYQQFLGQTGNRGVLRRRIPPAPCTSDVEAICNAYGLPPAPEGEARKLVREIARQSGIGKLSKYLRMARKLAVNRKQPVNWEHVLTTHATLETWARGEEGAE